VDPKSVLGTFMGQKLILREGGGEGRGGGEGGGGGGGRRRRRRKKNQPVNLIVEPNWFALNPTCSAVRGSQ
jgi:Predicted membrane protein